ncbi:MAG: YdcF family protein [Verrucomicrobia bacterium]|nr:YdcF family protein [Verrucomicrobiota bacterium]
MKWLIRKRRVATAILLAAIAVATTIATLFNWWVVRGGDASVFTDISTLPANDVGLVLGTAPTVKGGRTNLHFRNRIAAAAELWRVGKVKHLLLSGDNHTATYDEPTAMKGALLALGVPERAMTLDYAGVRTLDSVVRARKVFGQARLTLITDDFHAHRAVFLARHSGVEAVVFCSERVPASWSFRSRAREVAARCLAALDVFVFRRGPHFLGEPVEIQIAAQ